MGDEADVGLVDAHAEGVGGDDDRHPPFDEGILNGGALLIVHARVIAEGPDAGPLHRGDDFLRRLDAVAVHGRRRAQNRAGPHVDRFGRERDERPGAVGPRIHPGIYRHGGCPHRVDDPLRGIDPATGRVDVEVDRAGARGGGLSEAARDVRRQAVLDHAADGQVVDEGCLGRHRGRTGEEQGQRHQQPAAHREPLWGTPESTPVRVSDP